MSKTIKSKSHKGEYTADFIQGGMDELNNNPIKDAIYIVDKKVAKLFSERLDNIFACDRSGRCFSWMTVRVGHLNKK